MFDKIPLPEQVLGFPELRYMGSKHRLLPWLHGVLRSLDFETAADPFAGSGSVAYLLKSMGNRREARQAPRSQATVFSSATWQVESRRFMR